MRVSYNYSYFCCQPIFSVTVFVTNSTLALCCVGNVPDEGGQNITFSFLQPIMYCKSFSVSFTYIFWVRQLGTVQTEISHSHSQGHFVYFLQLQIVLLRAKRGHSFIASSHHHIKLKIWEKSEKKLLLYQNEFSPRDMKCSSSDERRAELYWWNCETGCCILMKSDTFKALCFFFFTKFFLLFTLVYQMGSCMENTVWPPKDAYKITQ